jgi:hypothetical protein
MIHGLLLCAHTVWCPNRYLNPRANLRRSGAPWPADICTVGGAKRPLARKACDGRRGPHGARWRHPPALLQNCPPTGGSSARSCNIARCLPSASGVGGTAMPREVRAGQGHFRAKEAEIIMCQRDPDQPLGSCKQGSFDLVGNCPLHASADLAVDRIEAFCRAEAMLHVNLFHLG